ncbi:hypothetical protein [Kangiella shandongensis]|uniref:hypothetical protein n=1 Tax=Kangiella shandongensis TaxID=2763258 RepID=UPI001CBBF3A9|nr:hypothetical protein [Kangiella shandongensis]
MTLIKQLITLSVFSVLVSCGGERLKPAEDDTFDKAKAYSLKYQDEYIDRMYSLTTQENGFVKESFYFNHPQKFISHKKFAVSPFNQFKSILKRTPNIGYAEATNLLRVKTKNYFAADCISVKRFFNDLEGHEFEYKRSDYSLGFDFPTYKYIYKDNKFPITKIVITAIKEHPVAELNQKAIDAIQSCPHPTEPPNLVQDR